MRARLRCILFCAASWQIRCHCPKFYAPHAAALWAKARGDAVAALHARMSQDAGWPTPEPLRVGLENALNAVGFAARVLVAGRYGPPSMGDALLEARAHAADARWIVLPLFPQYAFDTTRTSVDALYARLSPSERQRMQWVDAYADHPQYLDATAECIEETLAHLSPEARREVHLVFAARGVAVKTIDAKDPYPRQVEQTVTGVLARVTNPPRHTLAFQRTVPFAGIPLPYDNKLEPDLLHTLERLGAAGQRTVVVAPLTHVAETFETLHGLDITARQAALAAGVQSYFRVPTVGERDTFIAALADLVQQQAPLSEQDKAEATKIDGATDDLHRPGAATQNAPHA